MRHPDRFLPLFLLTLALAATATPAAAAQDKAAKPQVEKTNPYVERFKQLDRNGDGFVTLPEWPLDPDIYRRVDRDQDGRLSPHELLTPNVMPRNREELFQELDVDRDGRLSRAERRRNGAILDAMDRNRDGYVSRPEIENSWSPRATRRDQLVFRDLDRDRDNRLSRREWTGALPFDQLDRNRDGVISPNEWPRR